MILDDLDRQIILATQNGLPLVPQPYQHVADQLGIGADLLMQRLNAMQSQGKIRRIGVVPNHYALGYGFNGMTVWDVADQDVEEAGQILSGLPCVSHCYQRPRFLPDWPYNLFAMVHARQASEADALVLRLASALGARVRAHQVLYSTKILKKTGLRLRG